MSIIYVGLDVHTSNYTFCCYCVENDRSFAKVTTRPDYREILKYLDKIRKNQDAECEFLCGYEAGCLGYSLFHQLDRHGVKCVILAPSTMPKFRSQEIKTDKRDAEKIARYNTYSAVYVPDVDDDAIKEYIRMRNAQAATVKRIKQQIIALYTRHGFAYNKKSTWTKKHLDWIRSLKMNSDILQETLNEYLIIYQQAVEKLEGYDRRIEEFSQSEKYAEKVKMLSCFIGVKTHTAMSEIGDFHRFANAGQFAAFLGEHSSGNTQIRLGITKAGNAHLRYLLTEAAHHYGRGRVGCKSRVLKARQEGNATQVIAYAERANERLRRKFCRVSEHRPYNVAVTAIARELACFIWGMMTGHLL